MDYQFEKPVSVILGTVTYVVSGTREATEMLTRRWPPMVNGFCRDAAAQALQKCASRKRSSQLVKKAREAFVSAAAEADMLMYERQPRRESREATTEDPRQRHS
jgi:hypothetical protein